MKKTLALLGGAAAALMFAGAAHADNSGYVGASYSDGDTDANAWAVDGKAAFGSNIQLDAGYTNIHSGAANAYEIGGHYFNRGDHWLWGGFVGYNQISGGGDVHEWTVAGQTQYYVDHTILSGNLSYSQADGGGSSDVRTFQLTGDARFFANDNLTFHLGAGYGRLDTDFGDGNFLTYGAGGEWQPFSLPISIYGDVDVFDPEGTGNSTAWTVGVRYNWGGSLSDRYHSGAGLSTPTGFLAELF